MNQNPVIRFTRIGDLLKRSRLKAVLLVVLYGIVITASVYGTLFLVAAEGTRYGTVVYDGIPVTAERMSLERGEQEGYFKIESLTRNTSENEQQEQ